MLRGAAEQNSYGCARGEVLGAEGHRDTRDCREQCRNVLRHVQTQNTVLSGTLNMIARTFNVNRPTREFAHDSKGKCRQKIAVPRLSNPIKRFQICFHLATLKVH